MEKKNASRLVFFILGFLVASSIYANILLFLGIGSMHAVPEKGSCVINSSGKGEKYFSVEKKIPVVAVSSFSGEGVVGELDLKVIPGSGNVLISTNPFLEPDTQYSANLAVRAVERFTGERVSDKDFIISFNISGELVGGPSAGAAIAIATLAALENKSVKKDVAITGTIDSDGRIGRVGGILEKAKAASDAGFKMFLVPQGQTKVRYYEKRVEKEHIGFGFYLYNTYYVPKTMDIKDEVKEKWGIEIVEVSNLEEAARLMLE